MPDRLRNVVIVGDHAAITGGQAKVAIDSARLLADAGLTVTFFAACGPADPALIHPDIALHCLDQPDILSDPNRLHASMRGLWNRHAARRLRDLIQQFDPADTVLHCHGYAKALSPAIGPVLAAAPLATVYTMHEYFLACPNGGFYDYRRDQICTRTALGVACLTTNCDARRAAHKAWRVLRQALTWGPGRLPRGLKHVIYISETQRRAMASYLPQSAHLHHVPNPVRTPDLPPIEASKNNAFVFIGRLSREKGGTMFAAAARQLGLPAVFVGDGPERTAILAANPDAQITGWLPPDGVQHRLGQARALVMPSLWYECQPLAALEATARGVPVICGGWNAAAEAIRHGETGVIYDTPTPEALTAALRRGNTLPDFTPDRTPPTDPARHLARLHEVYAAMLGAAGQRAA